jgi:hypothetical protein
MSVVDYNDMQDIVISPRSNAVPGTIIGQILDAESSEGKAAQRIYDLKLCHNCGKRKGTMTWGDALAMTRGGGSQRCEVCVYSAQLVHALHRIRAIPRLVFLWLRANLRQS